MDDSTSASWEGTTSTAKGSSRPDAAAEAHQTSLAGLAQIGSVKLPPPRCSRHGRRSRHPHHNLLFSPTGDDNTKSKPARPYPDRALRAQIWAWRAPPAKPGPHAATASPPSGLRAETSPTELHRRRPKLSAIPRETVRSSSKRTGRSSPPPPAPRGKHPTDLASGSGERVEEEKDRRKRFPSARPIACGGERNERSVYCHISSRGINTPTFFNLKLARTEHFDPPLLQAQNS